MVQLVTRIRGVGIETADMLVNEVLLRTLRDRRAVARYAGLTGSPDETDSGARKTTMIVALARKLLIELWRLVTTGKVPEGVALHVP